jgi:hypothetical protein
MPRYTSSRYQSQRAPRYYDTPEGEAFSSFASGLTSGIEESYLKKQLQQEQEEERKLQALQETAKRRARLEDEGYQAVSPEQVVGTGEQIGYEPDRYAKQRSIGGVPYVEQLSPYERDLRAAELKKAQAAGITKPEKTDSSVVTEVNNIRRTMTDIQKQAVVEGGAGGTKALTPEMKMFYNQQAERLEALTGAPQAKYDLTPPVPEPEQPGMFGRMLGGAKKAVSGAIGLGRGLMGGQQPAELIPAREDKGFNEISMEVGAPTEGLTEVEPGRVLVISPDGEEFSLPIEQLEEAIQQGYIPK